jgi:cell division protein FtsN
MMLSRIETDSGINNPKIRKISDKKYRVYLGPFNEINSLQKSYNDISILEFENIEIIRND